MGVTELGLLGTYLLGSGVRDKQLVGTNMDASHKMELLLLEHLQSGPLETREAVNITEPVSVEWDVKTFGQMLRGGVAGL